MCHEQRFLKRAHFNNNTRLKTLIVVKPRAHNERTFAQTSAQFKSGYKIYKRLCLPQFGLSRKLQDVHFSWWSTNSNAQKRVCFWRSRVFQTANWMSFHINDFLCEYLSQGLLNWLFGIFWTLWFTTILLGWRGIQWWRRRRTTKSPSAGKAGSCQGSWICRQCWECCISACCIWYSSAFLIMLENLQDATLWLLVICCCLKHTYFST